MPARAERWELLALLGLTALAAYLRVYGARGGLTAPELGTLRVSGGGGLVDVLTAVRSERVFAPPGSYLLAWATGNLGEGAGCLRGASVAAGTLAVPATFGLGLRTVGSRGALAGAALMAISPFAVAVSSTAQPFAAAMLMVLVAAWAGLAAVERGGVGRWALYALAIAAALYAHYAAAFPLAVQLAWAVWVHADRWRGVLGTAAGVAVLYLPWLPGAADDRTAPARRALTRALPFDAEAVGRGLLRWLTGEPGTPLPDVPGRAGLVLLGAAAVVAALGALWMLWPRPRGKVVALPWRAWEPGSPPRLTGPPRRPSSPVSTVALVWLLAAATPVGLIVWSLVADTVFSAAALAPSLGPLLLALGALTTWLRPPTGALAFALLAGALGVGTALALF